MNKFYLRPCLLLVFSLVLSLRFATAADFRFRINEDLGSLDWGNGEVVPSVVLQLMEGLTTSGKKGEALPAMAASWELSRWERSPGIAFQLRKNAHWSDGRAVCAQDFVDAWLRALAPKFGSPFAHYFFDIEGASAYHSGQAEASKVRIRAKGCHRLEVGLARPTAFFPALVSHWVFFPVRLDLIERHGSHWAEPGKLVVNGPYVLESWQRDQKYILKKNQRYFDQGVLREAPEHLVALVVQEDATALNLFEKKKLDWMRDISFAEKPRLSKRATYHLYPSFVEYHLGFRFGGGSALTREQRCALGAALDKERIPEILRGGEVPAYTNVPSALGGRIKAGKKQDFAKVAFSDKELELFFYAKDIHIPLMEWVQHEWKKKLGLNVKLTRLEGKVYWARLYEDPPNVFLSGTTAAYAHPYSFLSELLSESRANWGRFSSARYDAAAREVASAAHAEQALRLAEKIAVDDECAIIPLYFRKTASLVSEDWTGFWINPMTYTYLKALRRKKP